MNLPCLQQKQNTAVSSSALYLLALCIIPPARKLLHILMHTYIHTYNIHTYIHTHINTYIHTYTYIHKYISGEVGGWVQPSHSESLGGISPTLNTKVCPMKHETFLRVLFPKDSFTDSYTLNFDFFYLHTYSMDNFSNKKS